MEFSAFFQKEVDNPPAYGLIMKYNTLRVDKGIKKLIFVEGSSDKRFYSATNIEELSADSYYIFQSYKDGVGGKEAVFYAYNGIKSDSSLYHDMNRCIFIVDRDWELSIKSANNLISGKDREKFTITQGHSMECYFLENENLAVIFSKLGIEEYLSDFKKVFDSFKDRTYHYWALKGTVEYAYKHELHIKYRKRYSFDEIFSFHFDRDEYCEFEKMNDEIELMETAIINDINLQKYCKKWDELIKKESRYMRGHDVFNLLFSYINQICGRMVSEIELFNMVPQFSVSLDIKHIS